MHYLSHLLPQKNRLTAKSGSVDGPSEKVQQDQALLYGERPSLTNGNILHIGLGPAVMKMCHRELGGGDDFVVLAF